MLSAFDIKTIKPPNMFETRTEKHIIDHLICDWRGSVFLCATVAAIPLSIIYIKYIQKFQILFAYSPKKTYICERNDSAIYLNVYW